MKLLFILAGGQEKASSRVRGYWVIRKLNEIGCHSQAVVSRGKISIIHQLFLIPFYNVIVFQKVYSRYHLWLAKIAKSIGKKVFVDIDDAPSRNNSEVTEKNLALQENLWVNHSQVLAEVLLKAG